MIHSGGKLLRPAYQLLFSAYGSDKDRESRRIGGLDRNAPHCLVDPRRYRRSCGHPPQVADHSFRIWQRCRCLCW